MSKLSGSSRANSRAQARLNNRLIQRVRRHGNFTALYGRSENGHRHPTLATTLPAPLPDVPLVRATLVASHPYQGTMQPEVEAPVLVVEVPETAAPEQEVTVPLPQAPETAAPPPPQPSPEEAPPMAEQEPSVAGSETASPPPPAGAPDEGVIPPAGDLASAEDSWRRLQRVWRKQEEKRASGVPPKVELEAPWLRRLFE